MSLNSNIINLSSNIILKFITIIGLGLILFSLSILLVVPPASNYEFSIYSVYPDFFWLSLFFGIIIGIFILLINALTNIRVKSQLIFGLLVIFLVDLILFFMPLIRGYLNYGSGDVLTHIGLMKDIIRTGNFGSTNIYPVDHILGTTVSYFTGLSTQQITLIIPVFFTFFSIVSFYLLSRIVFSNQSERLLLLTLVTIPSGSALAFMPSVQAAMLLPFFIYLIFKINFLEESGSFNFILIIMSILFVFFHPLQVIFIFLVLIIFKITSINQKRFIITNFFNKNINFLIILLPILFFSWNSYLYILTKNIKMILDIAFGSSEHISEFSSYSNIISKVNIDYFYLFDLFMKIYGQIFLICILSFVLSFFIFYKFIKHEKIPYILLIASSCFLFFFSLAMMGLLTVWNFGFHRFLSFALTFGIILIPPSWLEINRKIRCKLKLNILFSFITTLGILAIIIWISFFNIYSSPIIKQDNQQVTYSEYYGMISFFQNRDENYEIIEYGLSQDRIYDAIYGREYPRKNVQYYSSMEKGHPPDHFNAQENCSLGTYYSDEKYLIITNKGKFFYQNVYPEFSEKWRFYPSDFIRLEFDPSVEKIYYNDYLDIKLIMPISFESRR